MKHLIEEYQQQKKAAKKAAKFHERMEQKYNRSKWVVKISYAPLTSFEYNFDTLTTARNFAGLMARDNSVKVQLIKNI